jgi:hypothetical protein
MSDIKSHHDQLDELGYVILPDLMSTELLNGLRSRVEELFAEEGEDAGAEFKQEAGARRLANLVNKGTIFQKALAYPSVLELVRHVLGEGFKLSSLNARSANPHNARCQPLHCDMGGVPDAAGYWVCNSVWMLDDFTLDNGSLRVVPRSHHSRRLPQDELDDALAPHPDEVVLTAKAGSVIVINAHLWHGGLANATDRPRTAVHVFYCRRDKPQQQYQKQLVAPDIQTSLPAELRELLALDDPQNDELSAAPAVRSGFLK